MSTIAAPGYNYMNCLLQVRLLDTGARDRGSLFERQGAASQVGALLRVRRRLRHGSRARGARARHTAGAALKLLTVVATGGSEFLYFFTDI